MNRSRKVGSDSKGGDDIPDDLRCKRSDGKQWRCNARAMENKTLCEKHFIQAKKRAAGAAGSASPKKKMKIRSPVHELTEMKIKDFGLSKLTRNVSEPGIRYVESEPIRYVEPEPRSKLLLKGHGEVPSKPPKDLMNGRSKLFNGVSKKIEDNVDHPRAATRDSFLKDEVRESLGDFPEGEREFQSKMCHQCQRNDKGDIIHCQKCGKKTLLHTMHCKMVCWDD